MNRCKGTTKSGAQCKKQALEGSEFCRTHQDQESQDSRSTALVAQSKDPNRTRVPRKRHGRPFTDEDGERLNRVHRVVSAYRRLPPGWSPDRVWSEGENIVYDNPLKPGDRVKLPLEDYLELKRAHDADEEVTFPVLTDELIRDLLKDLRDLWGVPACCRICDMELDQRLHGKLNQLLRGKYDLPRTGGEMPAIKFRQTHPECRGIKRRLADLEAKLYSDPDKDLEKYREDQYRQIANEAYVETKPKDKNLSRRTVVLRMISIQNRLRGGSQ